MDDKERLKILEQALSQMLRPLKGLPFPVIVKALAGNQVIQIDRNSEADKLLVKKIERAIQFCAAELRSKPLIDLYDLLCDVKYEFNSDNRRLYAPSMILSQGEF